VADYGTGGYDDIIRYYKVAYTNVSGSDTLNRSELSAATTSRRREPGRPAAITIAAVRGRAREHHPLGGVRLGGWQRLQAPGSTAVATTVYYDSAAPRPNSGTLSPPRQ